MQLIKKYFNAGFLGAGGCTVSFLPRSSAGGGGGGGTVTSVGLALPVSVFVVTNSPVTSTGTLTGSFVNQTANTIFAGPATGGPAVPAFRALVSADLPAISVAWNAIIDPTGTQTLTFADGQLNAWTINSNTETFWNFTANALTTGTLINAGTSSLTTGNLLNFTSTSTALAAGNELINITMSGANGTNAITATAMRISVTNTNATSGTNIGLDINASGATTDNIAINATGKIRLAGDQFMIGDGRGIYFQTTSRGFINFGNDMYYYSADKFYHISGSTQMLSINSSTVAIGTTTLNGFGWLEITAGTTSKAAINFAAGTVKTTSVAGDIEYNGTNLFLTPGSAVRNTILMTATVSVVSPTLPNRTIAVSIGGTTYYIAAKTTND